MADETNPNSSGLVSAPIIPALPEIQAAGDATALLKTPPPVITPVIPSGFPQAVEVNTQLQGDYHTGPAPGAKPVNQKNGTLDFVKASVQALGNDEAVKDQFKYGRAYSYGAGYKNQNFERYYKHGKFDELGFSPYRDNDALYNEKGSWWDDFNRMRGEWDNLAFSGFKSIWGSEETANEEMEKGMAIGSSTRGGFGSSVINFGLNSAYTVGIIGELALEDAALAALEFGTMGAATPEVAAVGGARNAMAFGRLVKAWEGTSAFLKTLKNAEQAKDVFNAAKAGEKLTDFAKWANPFQRSMEWTTHLAKGTNGVSNLGNMAKVSKTFGNFYRDLRELNVAHSEARLEGEGAAVEYQNKLVDEFYNEHGRMPDNNEAKEIYDRAQSVKSSVTLANDITIYATNKLVFEDLFEGVRPGSKIAESFLEGSGRFLKRTAAKDFKAGMTAGVEGATAALTASEKSAGKKVADFLLTSAYVPWSRKYFVGNLGEALQENAQETIKIAAHDYYDKVHSDPSQLGFYGTLASIGKGTSAQFSGQGLETFLSGYMMGSLIQAGGKGMKSIASPAGRGASALANMATKGKYGQEWGAESESAKAKKQAEETDNDILNAANFVLDNGLIYGGHRADVAAGIKAAAEAKRAKAKEGDEKTARDMQNEMQLNHFDILARTGNMGLITEHVDDMMKLSDEDLLNAYNQPTKSDGSNMTAEDVRNKLQGLKNNAQGYQRAYDKAHRSRPNPHNPWMFDKEKHPEAYKDELDKYMAHEQALSDMIFANESYSNIADRMAKMGNELSGNGALSNFFNTSSAGSPLADVIGTDISLLVDPVLLSKHMQSLGDQIKVFSKGTAEERKKAKEAIDSMRHLKEWRVFAHTYAAELKNLGKPGATPEEIAATQKNADFLVAQMYKTFDKYVRHVAKTKNGFVFTEQMNKGFSLLKDFMALNADKQRMVHAINKFSDPNMFDRYKEIQKDIQKSQREQKLERLNKALEKFKAMALQNQMLNEIFDLGLFVLPEEVERLKNFSVTDFYNVADKSLLSTSDPKYRQAVDIIDKYAQEAGQMVKDKATPEAGSDEESRSMENYNATARPKFRPTAGGVGKDDRRTYRDLAKQFGFDPSSVRSTVAVEKVLKSIVDSEFATNREKALARRLLAVVKPGQVITFAADYSGPGVYKSDTKETIVDARYSSEDYQKGQNGHPVEHVILHELLHALTVEGLETDPEFKEAITKMLSTAMAYQLSPEGKAKFGDKPLYGLKNEAEFISEALTNDTFQRMLSRIPYTSTGKPSNLWNEFLKSVAKYIQRIFGVQKGSSLLDEAMHIITAKIDNRPTAKAQEKVQGVLKAGDKVSQSTPIGQIKTLALTSKPHAELIAKLADGYRKWTKDKEAVKDLSDDEITNREDFQDFMLKSGSTLHPINEFNAQMEKENKGIPGGKATTTTTKGKREVISNDEWQDFVNTGTVSDLTLKLIVDKYRAAGSKALSEREQAIFQAKTPEIESLLKKIQDEEIAAKEKAKIDANKAKAKPVEEVKEGQEVITPKALMEQYTEITNAEEIKAWENNAAAFLQMGDLDAFEKEFGEPFTPEFAMRQLTDKVKALAENLDFNTLQMGTVVILSDKKSVAVVSKNDGKTVSLMPYKMFKENFKLSPEGEWVKRSESINEEGVIPVPKEEVKNYIWIKNSEFKEMVEQTPEPTPEEKQESAETLVAEKERSADETNEILNNAETVDNAEAKNAAASLFSTCKR